MKSRVGRMKGKAKNLKEAETTYSSMNFRFFFEKMPLTELKKAARNAKSGQTIIYLLQNQTKIFKSKNCKLITPRCVEW